MTATDRLIDALRSHDRIPRQSGGAWSARCPAHDDHNPSLSLRQGDQGALLLCQAGCATADVMAALDLSMADLFDDRRGAEYRYDDGRIVNRTPDKRFPQAGNKNGRPTLYRLSEVTAAVQAGRPVYLVEGEKDADAVRLLGATATTAPMGAKNFRKVDATPLTGAHVVVVPDRDPSGETWLADVVTELTGKAASLRLAHAVIGKDAADHIASGYGLDDLVVSPLLVAEPAEWWHELAAQYSPINWLDLWTNTPDEIEWLCEPLLARGRSVALYSPAKAGKSLLALEIAAALAAGRAVIGNPAGDPLRVLYVDLENTPEDLRDRLTALGYGPTDLGNLAYLSFPSLPALDSAEGGRHLLACALKHRADLVIIDTVSRVIEGKEDAADTFNALYRHAMVHLKAKKIAALRLDHSGKDLERGQRGSSAKDGDVDAVWLLTKMTERTLYLTRRMSRSPAGADRIDLRREFSPLRHVATTAAANLPAEVQDAYDALDRAGVPMDLGRDRCRAALKEIGIDVGSNTTMAAIVKARKTHENLPGAGPEPSRHLHAVEPAPKPAPAEGITAGQSCPGQVGAGGAGAPPVTADDLPPTAPPYKGGRWAGQHTQPKSDDGLWGQALRPNGQYGPGHP
ncbi:MAG TPA: AAA family ATPase [Dermatophilaceae bacterium]